jgi:uncharacterized protein (DUF1800 family)
MKLRLIRLLFLASLAGLPARAELDTDGNQLSDLWEVKWNATGLAAMADADGDGFSNQIEAIAGTDPRSPLSRPGLLIQPGAPGLGAEVQWASVAGKRYTVLSAAELGGDWLPEQVADGTGGSLALGISTTEGAQFFRLAIADLDSDGDSLTDWEELQLGWDRFSAHTERYDQLDAARAAAGWNAASTVTVGLLDGEMSERWPDPGVIAIRRTGGLKPITVQFQLAGTATLDADYAANATTSITIPAGSREVWVEFTPIADSNDGETVETITLTALPGAGYTLGAQSTATVNLANETAASLPSAKAAARFLVQAAFGPDQDDPGDADIIPENVEQVMALGFEGWIDAEFAKPATHLQPFTVAAATIPEFYVDRKIAAWWARAMGAPETPGGPPVAYDALRHRVAFCLSQILVTSDRPEALAVQPVGMANYYDVLVDHAFGNYRDLLYHVTRHPVMGFYLSALKNQKPNPAANLFPDENFAREVMQLFSIGLWELNPDGTRKQSGGKDIPTYDNTHITNFARVFTGMTFAGSGGFANASENWTEPMRLVDAFHDCDPKTLLNGVTLPARVPSNPDTGAATDLDLHAAMDNLFQHPNVGPVLARQLIQRMVTSNPSPGYIERVALKFADNGSGVRGDLKAVVKAILLDPEARDPERMNDPHFGKVREPFLRVVNMARAFNAASPSGLYQLGSFFMDHYEEPMKSPSVFNFYLPGYTPPGEIQAADLVAPEFQIVNATSAVSAPNYYYNAILGGLHRWGTADPQRNTKLNLAHELTLVNGSTPEVDALLRRLDLALTYGTLHPRQMQIIRECVLRIDTSRNAYQNERIRAAIYLIVTSPDFCVLR